MLDDIKFREIGPKLAAARVLRRLPQQETAQKAGMSNGKLSSIETGLRPISLRDLQALTTVLVEADSDSN